MAYSFRSGPVSAARAALVRPGVFAIDSLAAVFGQETKKRGHRSEVGTIDKGATLALTSNSPRILEFLQMERECGGRNAERISDGACGHSLLTCPNKQSKNVEASLLGQRGQYADYLFIFHISKIMVISNNVKTSCEKISVPWTREVESQAFDVLEETGTSLTKSE